MCGLVYQRRNRSVAVSKAKYWKSFGVLFSAIVIISLLVGCGSASPSASSPQSAQPSASAKASQASKPVESAKPSTSAAPAAKEPLKIGAILTTSGPIGPTGSKQLDGVQVAVDEINAAGGILGRQVQLVLRDDAGDPTKALTAAQELVEKNGVSVIIGATLGGTSGAIMPYLTEQKVVLIGTGSSAPNDPKKYPYTFLGTQVPSQQAAALVRYAVDVMKVRKLGVIGDASAYGKMTVGDFKKELDAKGLQPLAVEEYPQGAPDLSVQVNNLKKAGVEAVLGATLGTDTARILKTMQSVGLQVPYISSVDSTSPAVIDGAGADAIKLAYAYSLRRISFSDKTPLPAKTAEFAAKLAKKLNQSSLRESMYYASRHYDLVYMIKQSIEKAQSAEGSKVAAQLEQMSFDGVQARYVFTKEDRGGVSFDEVVMVKLTNMKDGAFETAPGY
ncbi:MAG: ABC transporter substrate-binding protein [Chloroflexota bacterium]|nr:MAG: ABC transporter substrate-binding protein [Chloroflexota bacterium]